MEESQRGSQRSLSSIWTRKIPVTAFSFWNSIDELLSQRYQDSLVANVIETGEEILLKHKSDKIPKKELNQKNYKVSKMIRQKVRTLCPLIVMLKHLTKRTQT